MNSSPTQSSIGGQISERERIRREAAWRAKRNAAKNSNASGSGSGSVDARQVTNPLPIVAVEVAFDPQDVADHLNPQGDVKSEPELQGGNEPRNEALVSSTPRDAALTTTPDLPNGVKGEPEGISLAAIAGLIDRVPDKIDNVPPKENGPSSSAQNKATVALTETEDAVLAPNADGETEDNGDSPPAENGAVQEGAPFADEEPAVGHDDAGAGHEEYAEPVELTVVSLEDMKRAQAEMRIMSYSPITRIPDIRLLDREAREMAFEDAVKSYVGALDPGYMVRHNLLGTNPQRYLDGDFQSDTHKYLFVQAWKEEGDAAMKRAKKRNGRKRKKNRKAMLAPGNSSQASGSGGGRGGGGYWERSNRRRGNEKGSRYY